MNYLSTEFKQAAHLTNPTFFAYFPLGIFFGVLFTHADFPWYLAPTMSALVYAGAVQYVALSLMTTQSSLIAILLATCFVAMRNSFYGLSLTARFKKAPLAIRFFLIFGLVDATYAIFATHPIKDGQNDIKFCFYTTLLPYLYWVSGTFLGALFADVIPEVKGLDFIMVNFFFLIVMEYFLANKAVDALIVPIIASVIGYFFLPNYYLLIGILLCIFYLYLKIKVKND